MALAEPPVTAEPPLENAEAAEFLNRMQAWQKKLDSFPATFNHRSSISHGNVLDALMSYRGKYQVHLIFDPQKHGELTFRFVDQDREIVSIRGHRYSSFCIKDDRLYFAEYVTSLAGCTVVAYDLSTGKEFWRTRLHQEQPRGASGYSNRVGIRLPLGPNLEKDQYGDAIRISGSESYCDYIEVLDAKTGKSLAIRNYRVGFGSTEEDEKEPKEKNPPPAGSAGVFG